jgi:hypothetical protein
MEAASSGVVYNVIVRFLIRECRVFWFLGQTYRYV